MTLSINLRDRVIESLFILKTNYIENYRQTYITGLFAGDLESQLKIGEF